MAYLLSSSSITSDLVLDPKGDHAGRIKDLMIDTASGRIRYAVVSFGNFLGIGNKLFAVPWSALNVDLAKECFVIDVTRERLKQAEGFDPDNWPDMASPAWSRNQHTIWGVEYISAA